MRSLRQGKGLSLNDLAQLLGTSADVISRWERGQREPYVRNALALARALGVSVEELGFGDTLVVATVATLKAGDRCHDQGRPSMTGVVRTTRLISPHALRVRVQWPDELESIYVLLPLRPLAEGNPLFFGT